MGAHSFLIEMTPISMRGNNENDRVASLESVPIHLNEQSKCCVCYRDIKASQFISELEKGKKLAQFMMQKLPHIIPFSEVGCCCVVVLRPR